MNEYIDNLVGAATSYLIAAFGLLSPEGIMFTLGAATLAVRLIYDGVRLYRYIRDPQHMAGE